MTTLYKPVLIESAEQANALPRGTAATSGHYESFGPFAAIRTGDVPDWYMTTAPDTWADNAEMVGWTALVPIEAEEEFTTRSPGGTRYPSTTRNKALVHVKLSPGVVMESRLVTPWEAA